VVPKNKHLLAGVRPSMVCDLPLWLLKKQGRAKDKTDELGRLCSLHTISPGSQDECERLRYAERIEDLMRCQCELPLSR
jgi:hypothetical protein